MQSSPNYYVVIPAAGVGSRMQGTRPKQYLTLHGQTLLEHTLDVFVANPLITNIVVCIAPNDQQFAKLSLANTVVSTTGGASRAQSVLSGLHALDAAADDWVLVHDAARPFLTSTLLERLIRELGHDDVGGILAVQAKDTLKLENEDQRIRKTINREGVWQAQTPQMFRYKLLKESLASALTNGFSITDEASAIEWAGFAPKLIVGDARNLKVTTPDDLAFAEFLLRR